MCVCFLQNHLGSDYDLERVIDDWILMGFLVGNDFIPHLPNLHINHDALPLLYKTYISVLPNLGGETHTHIHTQYYSTCTLLTVFTGLKQRNICFFCLSPKISFMYAGYLNENGHLNLRNFEKYLEKLAEVRSQCENDLLMDI